MQRFNPQSKSTMSSSPSSSSGSSGSSVSSPPWKTVENKKKNNNNKKKLGTAAAGAGAGAGATKAKVWRATKTYGVSSDATHVPLPPPKENELSICIPRTFKNIRSQRVFETFRRLNLGYIDGVDVVEKKDDTGVDFVRIFVHFTKWNHNNPSAKNFREQLLKGEQVNIVYDEPWFWKCSLSRLPRVTQPVAAAAAPAVEE